jgi:hypothetical protein
MRSDTLDPTTIAVKVGFTLLAAGAPG